MGRTTEQPPLAPAERAGLRLLVLAPAVLVLVSIVLPLGFLVREQWAPLQAFDRRVSDAAFGLVLDSDVVRVAAALLTNLGAPVLVYIAAATLAALLLRAGGRRSALFLAVAVAGAYVLSSTGKAVVDRARPVFEDPVASARGASFPSGHAAGAAALYLAAAIVLPVLLPRISRRLLLAVAVVVPLVVASTRVLLGVHYPSDVVAGLLLGWGWVAACAAVFVAWRADEGRPTDDVLEDGVEPR